MEEIFIKGPYPRQLLTAIGLDWNTGMFLIAYAIVEDKKQRYVGMVHPQFDIILGIENGHAYVFMSHKQKGLGLAFANLILMSNIDIV